MRTGRNELRAQILASVRRCPGLTARQIALRGGLRPDSVITVIWRLIQDGMLRRDHADALQGWQYYVNEPTGRGNGVSTAASGEEESGRTVSGERMPAGDAAVSLRRVREEESGS